MIHLRSAFYRYEVAASGFLQDAVDWSGTDVRWKNSFVLDTDFSTC